MGCISSKGQGRSSSYDPTVLASETPFTVSEIEALYVLFKKLSSSTTGDRLIHKKELRVALFQSHNKHNLFADRVFDLFDLKQNGVIEFEEFVKSLAIFHPKADREDKIVFAFKLYDLGQTGYIEQEETKIPGPSNINEKCNFGFISNDLLNQCFVILKEMVLALLKESDLTLSEDDVKSIVDKTFDDADSKGDGKIDLEEWKDYVSRNPSLIKNMTLPYLMDITMAFPSFVLNSEVKESDMVA